MPWACAAVRIPEPTWRPTRGAVITFQMHYHKEVGPGTGVWDQSSMALEFHDSPVTHLLKVDAIAHGAFEIPPYNGNWKVATVRVISEVSRIVHEACPGPHEIIRLECVSDLVCRGELGVPELHPSATPSLARRVSA